MEVRLHPDVRTYLDDLEDSGTGRCEDSLKRLADEPYRSRPKCDIKKLKGKDKEMYRLRVGDHRFEYFVEDDKVWIVEAFRRGRGYRQEGNKFRSQIIASGRKKVRARTTI